MLFEVDFDLPCASEVEALLAGRCESLLEILLGQDLLVWTRVGWRQANSLRNLNTSCVVQLDLEGTEMYGISESHLPVSIRK